MNWNNVNLNSEYNRQRANNKTDSKEVLHTQGEWSVVTGLIAPNDLCVHSKGELICFMPTENTAITRIPVIFGKREISEANAELNSKSSKQLPKAIG